MSHALNTDASVPYALAPNALITDSLIAHARRNPDQMAIEGGAAQLSYGELSHRIRQVATTVEALSPVEFSSGDPSAERYGIPWVATALTSGVELLETFLGTAMAGGLTMVLNPDWPIAQIQTVLNRWTPEALVAEAPLIERLGVETTAQKAEAMSPVILTAGAMSVSGSDATGTEASWSSCSKNLQNDSRSFAASFPDTQGTPGEFPKTSPISDQTPFYIGFTSGTTGMPKGVIRHHRSWVKSMAASRVEFGLTSADQILVPGSLVHSLSLYTAVETLVNGATLHILPAFNPKEVLQRLQDRPVTRLVAVPTLLGAIARAASRHSRTFPHLRSVISGGSKLRPSLRQQLHTVFPNADILEYYGASELSFISLASSRESVPSVSVGRAFHDVTLSIRCEDGHEAHPGEIGWIGIQSEMVCLGYLDPTDGTGFRLEQGWATVGDRGWMDERGYLYLVGREHDMLICNGINVFPAEIEAVMLEHPAVEDVAVIGLPDDCRGDILCAIVKLTDVRSPHPIGLTDYLKSRLESAKWPRHFFQIQTFPLTVSGKINRSALKAQLLKGELVTCKS